MHIQVLSESVVNGLRSTGGDEVVESIKFVDYFDKFFDSVNVSSLSQRKPFKQPYYSKDDFRLKVSMHSVSHDNYQLIASQWLTDVFLKHLENWEATVQSREGYQPTVGMTKEQKAKLKAERQLMLLSNETRQGLRIT